MNKNTKILIGLGALILLVLGGFIGFSFKVGPATMNVGRASITDLVAVVATSTDFTVVQGTVYSLIGTSTPCTSRKITTGNFGINLQFGNEQGDKLTGFIGHWQGASTTVDYDGSLTGCGLVRVRSDATGIIHVTDYR